MNLSNDELALKLEQLAVDIKQEKFGNQNHFDSYAFLCEFEALIKLAKMDWIVNFIYAPSFKNANEIPPMPNVKSPRLKDREQRCENCRFRRYGQCHRYAPKSAILITMQWPCIAAVNDWCGEWEPKENE